MNSGILFLSTAFCSIRRPYITFKLPRRDKDTPPRLRNFFRYQAIGMCHFRSLWNGLCDRRRAEITVMQFIGQSLPAHHFFLRHSGNATDPIWKVLFSSNGISSWTLLKPQHSNPNPNPLANQLRCIDFLTPPTPLIIPHRLPAFYESLMPLKNWGLIHARCSKRSLKHSIHFWGIFSKFITDFYNTSFL